MKQHQQSTRHLLAAGCLFSLLTLPALGQLPSTQASAGFPGMFVDVTQRLGINFQYRASHT